MKIIEKFKDRAIQRSGLDLFTKRDAIDLIKECQKLGIKIQFLKLLTQLIFPKPIITKYN